MFDNKGAFLLSLRPIHGSDYLDVDFFNSCDTG